MYQNFDHKMNPRNRIRGIRSKNLDPRNRGIGCKEFDSRNLGWIESIPWTHNNPNIFTKSAKNCERCLLKIWKMKPADNFRHICTFYGLFGLLWRAGRYLSNPDSSKNIQGIHPNISEIKPGIFSLGTLSLSYCKEFIPGSYNPFPGFRNLFPGPVTPSWG